MERIIIMRNLIEEFESEFESESDGNGTIIINEDNNDTDTDTDTDTATIDDTTNGLIGNSTAIMSISIILSMIATVFCIISIIFVCWYKKNPIVKMAQPGFLFLILGGATSIAISPLFVILPSTSKRWRNHVFLDTMCILFIWWFIINGFIFVYMGLFGKLWRIKKVTRIRRGLPPVKRWHTRWPLEVMRLLAVAITVTWTFLDPPTWKIFKKTTNNDSVIEIVGYCSYQLEYLAPLICITVLSAILGAGMGWQTRKLPEELSDGPRIFQIYCCHVVFTIVFGLLYLIGRLIGITSAMVFGVTLYCVSISASSVALIIVPKMYYIWHEHNHNGELPEGVTMIGRGQTHIGGLSPPPQQQQQQPIINNGDDNS
jgi:hypothetical protein